MSAPGVREGTRDADLPLLPPPSAGALALRVLERRRGIMRAGLVVSALVATSLLLLPRSYSVQSIVLPISADVSTSRLAGLAAQFGIPAFGGSAGQSPEFYQAYLRSKELLGRVVDAQLTYPDREGYWHSGDSILVRGTLVDVLGLGRMGARGRERAIERLASYSTISVDRVAGTVSLTVVSRSPGLSVALSEAYLRELHEFNQTQRRTQAGAERTFVAERLDEARGQLRLTEDSLQRFLQENRAFSEAAHLVFVHDRLRRSVALRQQIVASLSETFEQARIDEVRDTPVLTIVQSPATPGAPDRRGLLLKTIIAFVAGVSVMTTLVVLAGSLGPAAGEDVATVRQLRVLIAEARGDLRRPWRLF